MNNLLNSLDTDNKIFNNIVNERRSQHERPSILAFLTPSTNLFDIFRLIKLHELNKAGFYTILIIENYEKKEEYDFFNKVIEILIPNNKRVFLYEDIIKELFSNKEYNQLMFSYKIGILKILSKYPEMNNLSLSDLSKFLSQYFILKNSKLLINQEADFFLTTSYKDLFFKSIPNIDETKLPTKIIFENILLQWNFLSSIKVLEREIGKKKFSRNQLDLLKNSLMPLESIIQGSIKDKSLLQVITEIKKFFETPKSKKEYFSTKSNFKETIYSLNNETRRRILSLLVKRGPLKAEEIRKEINLNLEKKYSLVNIIKHLNLLLSLKLINKTKRSYEINTTRIVLDMPISWFTEY